MFHLLASFPKAVAHIHHELVKMYPALGFQRDALEKKVHEHRLAPADSSGNVNSAPLFVGDVSLIEKLGQTKAGLFDVREPVCQRIEHGDHPLLSRIALNCSSCNESVIALSDGGEI